MCGIFGYWGKQNAAVVLADGLQRLEYRGYDSAGIAVMQGDGTLACCKKAGSVEQLKRKLQTQPLPFAPVGIGHTRWATHGKPTDENAHPHLSAGGRIAVVHNGIVENYRELKEELQANGYRFVSETDTEILANLIEREYAFSDGDLLRAVMRATARVTGSYAVAVLGEGQLVAAKKQSPLVVAVGEDEVFLSSDLPTLAAYGAEVYRLQDGEFVKIEKNRVSFFTQNGRVTKLPMRFRARSEAPVLSGTETFLQKEIFETPAALRRTFLSLSGQPCGYPQVNRVLFVGCGTALNAGRIGAHWVQRFCGIPAAAVSGSEYVYGAVPTNEKTLVVAVTQSGETAETLAALKKAGEAGAKTLAVTNVENSSVCFLAEEVLPISAGAEISVASSKAYVCQLGAILLLVQAMASARKREFAVSYPALADACERSLQCAPVVEEWSRELLRFRKVLFVGRTLDYVTAREGALKYQEITYRPAFALAGGELKHGPLALVDRTCAVVHPAFALPEKVRSSLAEISSRGGKTYCLSCFSQLQADSFRFLSLPEAGEFSPLYSVLPLQLLACDTARFLGKNIDRPRNLAKSVTVE